MKDMVKNAKPLTEEYIRRLLAKGNGANKADFESVVAMLLDGVQPVSVMASAPTAPAPSVSVMDEEDTVPANKTRRAKKSDEQPQADSEGD